MRGRSGSERHSCHRVQLNPISEVHSFRVHRDLNYTPVVNSTSNSCSTRWLGYWVRILRPEGLVPDGFDTIQPLTTFLFVDRRCHTERDLSKNLQAIVATKTRTRTLSSIGTASGIFFPSIRLRQYWRSALTRPSLRTCLEFWFSRSVDCMFTHLERSKSAC